MSVSNPDDVDDMPDLLPPTGTIYSSTSPPQTFTPQALYTNHFSQPIMTTTTTSSSSSLPFPSLIGVASGPGAWSQSAANAATTIPNPATTAATTTTTAPPASSTNASVSPRVATAAHVPVPASLAFAANLAAPDSHSHSHSHDGVTCNHSHGAPPPNHHGHSHHSPSTSTSSSSASSYSVPSSYAAPSSVGDHGHSHGGTACSGHHDDHGHSHSSTLTSRRSPLNSPPIIYDEPSKPRGSYIKRFTSWVRLAYRGGGDSRNVLIVICLKFAFMSIQFGWGVYNQNYGLISSSFHTGFDVIALACALIATLNAKYPAKHPYSYGFDRQEIVAAFTNAIFLFFVATFMIIETFHTAYFPPEVERDDIVLAALGFCMDLLGLGLFHSYLILKSSTELPESAANWTISTLATAGRGHNENMHGVSLHVVSDLVGHSSLLIAVWINQIYPEFTFIFALSFLASAILIIQLVWPLFQQTGAILLMTTPQSIRLGLDRCIREISFYDGVLELRSAHWWTQVPGVIVGSLHIRIRADADEQVILNYVNSVLKKYVSILTVQVEKDQIPVNWMIQNARSP